MSAVWPAMAMPIVRTCWTNSSIARSTRNPGIASSLSSVPPLCPSARPESLATGTPAAATSGATTRVALSPTPPVECLSTFRPGMEDRSSCRPLAAMARVKAVVSGRGSASGCCAELLDEEGVHARRRREVLVELDEQRRMAAVRPDRAGAGWCGATGVALDVAIVEVQVEADEFAVDRILLV